MNVVAQKAEFHRQKTKNDIAEAKEKDPNLTVAVKFDDGVILNGNKENCRAISMEYCNQDTGLEQRFLQLTSEVDKTSNCSTKKNDINLSSGGGREQNKIFFKSL